MTKQHRRGLQRQTLTRQALARIVTLVALVLLPSVAASQLSQDRWEVGFTFGNANLRSSDDNFDLEFRGEARVGLLLSEHLELELQLMRADAPLDATLSTALVGLTFNFTPDRKITPYASIGAGHAFFEDTDLLGRGDVSDDSFAHQFALGGRLFLGRDKPMAVRVEISSLGVDLDETESDRFVSFAAGLTWTFGDRGKGRRAPQQTNVPRHSGTRDLQAAPVQ